MDTGKSEHTFDEILDPDPWLVGSLVIAGVAMVAQLAQLAIQLAEARPTTLFRSTVALGHMHRVLQDTIRETEIIIRFLAKVETPGDPMDEIFQFGSARLEMSRVDLADYTHKFQMLSHSIDALHYMTMQLISGDSPNAERFGREIISEFKDINDRVNNMHAGRRTLGETLDDCLLLLRQFERIATRIEERN